MAARHYFLTVAVATALTSATVMAQQETDAPMTFLNSGFLDYLIKNAAVSGVCVPGPVSIDVSV